VLTNCEEVELRYGKNAAKRLRPARDRFPHLPHAPVIFERHHFSAEELGLWGMLWEDATITGLIGGKLVAEVRYVADPVATELTVVADRETIASTAKDCVRVMVRALDQAGHRLPFLFEPVAIAVTGAGCLLGPSLVPLRGGSTGFWVESTGARGPITVAVSSALLGTTTIALRAE
jgi:beta-galactosidase